MNKKILKALNEQVVFELNAAYLYLGMSLAMADNKMAGYSSWLRKQYEEETGHAMKFIQYLQDRDQSVALGDVKHTVVKEKTPLEIAKAVLKHEEGITAKISALYGIALEEKDYATVEFLSYFVREQVEEEATARDVVDQFTFAGDNKSSQLLVDAKLGGRQ